jgi:hypothetical protein
MSSNSNRRVTVFLRVMKYLLLSIGLLVGISLGIKSIYPYFSKNTSIELTSRIKGISENLRNTTTEINLLQHELEQKIELVENLNEEAKKAEALITLSKDQVDAVRSNFNSEQSKNSTLNLLITIAISTLFFIVSRFSKLKMEDKQQVGKG